MEALDHWEKMVKALSLPIEKFELDYFSGFDLRAFSSYLEQDKKKMDSTLRLVLVNGVGVCYVEEVSVKDFKTKILNHEEFKR